MKGDRKQKLSWPQWSPGGMKGPLRRGVFPDPHPSWGHPALSSTPRGRVTGACQGSLSAKPRPSPCPATKSHTYHDGKDEGDEVERPDGAEAGGDGEDEVIFGDVSVLGIGGGGDGGRPPRAGPGGRPRERGLPGPLGHHLEGQAVAVVLQVQGPREGLGRLQGHVILVPHLGEERLHLWQVWGRGGAWLLRRAKRRLPGVGHAGLGLGLLQLQAGKRGSSGSSAHHSSAQSGGLQVRGRGVTQESEGQRGNGRLGFSRPAEFRGSRSLQVPSSLRPTLLVLLTAQMGGEAREQLQGQREDCSSPERGLG